MYVGRVRIQDRPVKSDSPNDLSCAGGSFMASQFVRRQRRQRPGAFM